MTKWNHKEEWHKRGKDFLVVISRHEVMRTEASIFGFDEGPHRWAVYAYIYPKHQHFAKFSGTDMWQDASDLGFHRGCSFLRYHYEADGKVTSVQCGGDYNHLYDDRFTNMATAEDARAVFNDADELFDRLTRIGAVCAAS